MNGLTVPNYVAETTYCQFTAGTVVVLGDGLNLSGLGATNVANLLSDSNTTSLGMGSDLVTTYITFDIEGDDAVADLTLSNGASTTILGNGTAFTNYTGELEISGESTVLNLGMSADDDYFSYVGSSYTQGGTFDGTVTVGTSGTLNVNAGTWTLGGLSVTGTADINSTLIISGTDAAITETAASLAITGTFTVNDGGILQVSDKVLEVAIATTDDDSVVVADTDVATDLQGTITFDGGTLLIDGTGYTTTDLTAILDSIEKDDSGSDGYVGLTGTINFDATTELTDGYVNAAAADGLNIANQEGDLSKVYADGDTELTASFTATGIVSGADALTITGSTITLQSDANTNAIATASGEKVDLTLGSSSTTTSLSIEGLADLNSLTVDSSATTVSINVGSSSAAGILKASDVSLNGASLFLDPVWEDGSTISSASKAGLVFDSNVDGLITVGQNSYLVLGSTDTDAAEEAFNSFGLTWDEDGITAALFISGAQTVLDTESSGTTGGITIDGAINTDNYDSSSSVASGTVSFAAGSALIVDAGSLEGATALTATTIDVDAGSQLLIVATDLTLDENDEAKVNIATATTTLTVESGAWGYNDTEGTSTIAVDSVLLEVSTDYAGSGTSYAVTVSKVDAADIFTDMDGDLASHLDGYAPGANNFIDKAVALDAENAKIGKSIEGAAKIGHAGGIGAGLANVNIAGTNNVNARLGDSVAFNDKDTSNMLAMNGDGAVVPMNGAQAGLGVWFMPMYKHTNASGFESGDYDYGFSTDLYGATLGADYTFASSLRLGLALNVGTGESDSTGDFDNTENDFDYVGITAYAGMSLGNIGLYADMGYTASSNDITQKNAAGTLTADADADLFSIGVKADYKVALNNFNVTPYAGARLNYYEIDGFNTKYYGESVVSTDSSDYTIIEFPIGLTFDTTMEAAGWDITPNATLGVKFAAGDLDHDQRVSFNGLAGSATVSSEVADAVTFQGGLGIGAAKDAYSIDFGYTLDLSDNMESHGFNLNLRYEF
ncbi:MAG: autotransporter domain-containing protein [Pseudomonadota bacterium]